MGFANGTLIQLNHDTTKPIEQLIIPELVLVFDYTLEHLANPRQLPVDFSSGNPGGRAENCVAIQYNVNGELQTLICTPDQQFLMKDGTMKLAAKLVAGQDNLLMITDESVLIENVTVKETVLGFHAISTSLKLPASINGNLIVANGIICGDYALQITP